MAAIEDGAALPGGDGTTVLLARYTLREALGRGGMATVFRAWDAKLGREVAVKVFRAAEVGDDAERQRREIRLLASASHPHLVTLLDAEWPRAGDSAQTPGFLVMELVDGESLRRVIDRTGGDGALARRVLVELSDALASLHRRGIVHRDLKPENILVDAASGSLKLADFGIAQLIGEEPITLAGTVIGTAAYLSPEQLGGGRVGPPADVYALGLVALETITGQRVFPGGSVESALARLSRDPGIPAELPLPWQELLRAMTARDPAERPDSVVVAAGAQQLPEVPAGRPLGAASAGLAETEAVSQTALLGATEALPAAAASRSAVATPPAQTMPTEPLSELRPRRGRRVLAEGAAVLLVAAASAAVALALSQGHASGTATDPAAPPSPVPTVTETLVPRPAATESSEPVAPVQNTAPTGAPADAGVTGGTGGGTSTAVTGTGGNGPAAGNGDPHGNGHGPGAGHGGGNGHGNH